MRLLFQLLLVSILFPSCAVFKNRETRSAQEIKREVAHSPVFSKAFTGFTLLDPATGKTLADFNGDHYFTPASNAKILTLATCLEVLGDSVPGLRTTNFKDRSDTINYLRPTGDPTFLHPAFKNWQPVFQFLENCYGPSIIDLDVFQDTRFGHGWAWDDYNEDYSAERSAMPIFGNLMTVKKINGRWHHFPFDHFDKWGWNLIEHGTIKDLPRTGLPLRPEESGIVYIPPNETLPEGFTKDIPIRGPSFLLTMGHLLKDTLQNPNFSIHQSYTKEMEQEEKKLLRNNLNWRTIYSAPLDTVLRRMMYQSDNFIAEQMLLLCAGVKFEFMQQDTMIQWMLDSALSTLPQKPRWVDGSGLSRYNLITPQSIAQVLLKLWKEQSREQIFSLFPAGGVNGTISDWYAGKNDKPYVFAKTGSMGGVHCLSGYVVCRSGKTLIFSFMHNNFVGSSRAWKLEMQRILEMLRDRF